MAQQKGNTSDSRGGLCVCYGDGIFLVAGGCRFDGDREERNGSGDMKMIRVGYE